MHGSVVKIGGLKIGRLEVNSKGVEWHACFNCPSRNEDLQNQTPGMDEKQLLNKGFEASEDFFEKLRFSLNQGFLEGWLLRLTRSSANRKQK